MALNVKAGISHLEHLEDLVIGTQKSQTSATDGIELAVDAVREFVKSIDKESSNLEFSTKIDGAPSLYFGTDERGEFFVGTKGVLNKTQKINFTLADIRKNHQGELVRILSDCYKTLKPAYNEIGLAAQGDLLWSNKSQKTKKNIHDNDYLTFQPNTIMYAVPVDKKSDSYNEINRAKVGIVIHGTYDTINRNGRVEFERTEGSQSIKSLAEDINQDKNTFCIHPFIDDMDALEVADEEIVAIRDALSEVEGVIDEIDPTFNELWKTSDDRGVKFAKKYLPMFINSEVKVGDGSVVSQSDEDKFINMFIRKLKGYLRYREELEQGKVKSPKSKQTISKNLKEFKKWINNSKESIRPILSAFFKLMNIKNLVLKVFDDVEGKLGETFVVDKKNDYKLIATKEEGYVLLHGNNMVKIVDRVEFSRNNILYSPFQESSDGIVASVYEDVISAQETFEDLPAEDMIEAMNNMQNYNAIYIGKFQPPTKAHIEVIKKLAGQFDKVLVFVSGKDNPLDAKTRMKAIKSDERIRGMGDTIKVGTGDVGSIWGLSSKNDEVRKESVDDIRTMFDLDEDDKKPIVLAMGKEVAGNVGEEDRFDKTKALKTMFIVNDNGKPTKKKFTGLYGIDLLKKAGQKIGARQIRELISNDEYEQAMEQMAGDKNIKDDIVDKIKSSFNEDNDEEYEEESINTDDAFDFILDALGD